MATLDDILAPTPKEQGIIDREREASGQPAPTTGTAARLPQNSGTQQPAVPAIGNTPKEQGIIDRQNEAEREVSGISVVEQPQLKTRPRLSYTEMVEKLSPYAPPTQEELEAERKRRRRNAVFAAIGDGISALSNLYFTTQGAPNAYNGKNSLSERMLERWDKIDKERQENGQAYFSQYLKAQAMDDERERDDRNWKHQLKREEVSDQRYNDEWQHKKERENVADDQWRQQFTYKKDRDKVEDDHWTRSFNESKRQFNVSSAQSAQRISMESQRLAQEMNKGKVTFALGKGKGTISIPSEALNSSNVSYVFSKLPQTVRDQVHGEAIYDQKKRKVVGYKEPTTESMLIAIGTNIETSGEAQEALREISGQKINTANKTMPGVGGKGKMPGVK